MTDYTNLPSGAQLTDVETIVGIKSSTSGETTPLHLAIPLRLSQGPKGDMVLAAFEQDTLEEVTQSVAVLLGTQVGERYRDAPDYGVPELVNSDPIVLSMAETAIKEFEPRAATTFTVGPKVGDGSQEVRVNISLAAGGADITPSLDR